LPLAGAASEPLASPTCLALWRAFLFSSTSATAGGFVGVGLEGKPILRGAEVFGDFATRAEE
jgi:hypothetical protein